MADTFIIYRVETAPKIYAFREVDQELTFNFEAYPVLTTSNVSGGGGTTYTFVDADLDENGWVYFIHSYGSTADVSVFMPTLPPIEVNPDSVTYEFNRVGVNLATYRPLTGAWSILIEV